MDRTYKEDIPSTRRALEELKKEFSGLASTTDWTHLRIEPLLDHVKSLARLPGASQCSVDQRTERCASLGGGLCRAFQGVAHDRPRLRMRRAMVWDPSEISELL